MTVSTDKALVLWDFVERFQDLSDTTLAELGNMYQHGHGVSQTSTSRVMYQFAEFGVLWLMALREARKAA